MSYSLPTVGHEVQVEQRGRRVTLCFVAATQAKADALAEYLVAQLRDGTLQITVMGKPTSVSRDFPREH